ncbi:MAG: septal ring lytic transglycosylase RlpA family protein [Candidatus Omnitrophica bacterium]|nr:septal ring lytic transglycosylase RlpA family protein [Candidatus Omnitrophota bacterium]
MNKRFIFILILAFLLILTLVFEKDRIKNKSFSKNSTFYCIASWYSKGKYQDGSDFKGDTWTCASNIFPRGTRLKLTLGTKSAKVIVNDFMKYNKKYRQIDCSKKVAAHLGFLRKGIAKIKVEILSINLEKKKNEKKRKE